MSAPNVPGFYGKLPILGDFISRRLPGRFVQPWDTWLQEALATSKVQLGSEWLESYLYSPIWRFILSAGICGPTAWAGVLMPSVDKVNRYFPLTLAVAIQERTAIPELFATAASWFGRLERAALLGLEDNINLDGFDCYLQEQVFDIPGPTGEPDACRGDAAQGPSNLVLHIGMASLEQIAQACLQLRSALLAKFLPIYSLWTTSGSERISPVFLVYDGLPAVATYAEFLTGRRQQV